MAPEFLLRQLMRPSFGPAGCSTLMPEAFVAPLDVYLRSSKSLTSKPKVSLLQRCHLQHSAHHKTFDQS